VYPPNDPGSNTIYPSPPPSEPLAVPATLPVSASLRTPLVQVSARAPEAPPNPDTELLREAHERFLVCLAAEGSMRKEWLAELNFVDGLEHWDADMKQERKGRPCLVYDRIGPSIDMVVNDMRQNPPEAKVIPVGDGSDKYTSEILQGMLRNIDQDSGAEVAYMTAYEHAVKIGRGWWRIVLEYEGDNSFEQKLVVKRVPNPLSIYPDPAAIEHDYSDMMYLFATEDLSRSLFEQLYPNAETSSIDFESAGNVKGAEWYPDGSIRVAEYWKVTIEQ
jgi:hypothetical protein